MPPGKSPTLLPRPGWADRLLAVPCYLGLAPLLATWRRFRERPFLQHHLAQGLAVGLLFVLLALALLAGAVGWAWVIINRRDVIEAVDNADDWVTLGVLVAWAAVAAAGIVLALCGSRWRLPLVYRLAAGPRRTRIARAAHFAAYGLLVLVVGLTCHAAAICRSDDGPAPVYVLYDDVDVVPRWVFQLGAYPIALTADARWGRGSTVVSQLRRPALDRALEHGRVVILLCHGRGGYIASNHICVDAPRPAAGAPAVPHLVFASPVPVSGAEWEAVPVGGRTQLAYITACDGGRNAAGWQATLAPAEVITFDRLSAMLEHAYWLWLVAPGKVRDLPDPPAAAALAGGGGRR
jgi:hypothetical protein